MNKMKPEDIYKWLDEIANNENLKQCSGIPSTAEAALYLFREKDAEIERLNKEVDRLSQVVQYHDGHISDAQKDILGEFEERLLRAFPCANAILEKSICDIIQQVANGLREELK